MNYCYERYIVVIAVSTFWTVYSKFKFNVSLMFIKFIFITCLF